MAGVTAGSALFYTALYGGTALTAYSAYQQGQTAAASAKQSAAFDDFNAKVAKREADAERKASDFEAVQHTRRSKQLKARGRAIRGASGVTPEGSPLLMAEDTAAQLALEGANIRTTGARRVQALKSRSILDTASARAKRSTAPGFRRAGAIGAGTSILQGGAQAAYYGSQL